MHASRSHVHLPTYVHMRIDLYTHTRAHACAAQRPRAYVHIYKTHVCMRAVLHTDGAMMRINLGQCQEMKEDSKALELALRRDTPGRFDRGVADADVLALARLTETEQVCGRVWGKEREREMCGLH